MKTYSFFAGIMISSVLSAQIVTINTTGEYDLKTNEPLEQGVRIATELAKQAAIEKAGTAVVSSFKITRDSQGNDKAVLNATSYAAAIVKTNVDDVQNDNGHIIVSITASIDDSKVDEFLKGGPILHEKMAELKASNDELQDALEVNLIELRSLDARYAKALSIGVSKEDIDYLRNALALKIEETDNILQSLGDVQEKTSHAFLPKDSLLKQALRQQLNEHQNRYDTKVLMGAYDTMLQWYSRHTKVDIDPKSITLDTHNDKTDISLKVRSLAINPDAKLDPLYNTYEESVRHNRDLTFPFYSAFTTEVWETVKSSQVRLPYIGVERKTIKEYGDKPFVVASNPSFQSLPWKKYQKKSRSQKFDCSLVADHKDQDQCELNAYAFSKTLVLRVGIEGTKYHTDYPLHRASSYDEYSTKIQQGVKHTLMVNGDFSITIKGVSVSDLSKADDLYAKVMIADSTPTNDEYNEIKDLERLYSK